MKSREEVISYMHSKEFWDQIDKMKKSAWHFGLCELRLLMDFIYESPPKNDKEIITFFSCNFKPK